MHKYRDMVKEFLVGYIIETRKGKGLKKNAMSIWLRIDPRSYADIEAKKCGISAASLLLFECCLEDLELLDMIHEFRGNLEKLDEQAAM